MAPNKLLVVFAVSHTDIDQAQDVASWIADLGGCKDFDALIFAGQLTPQDKLDKLIVQHQFSFAAVFNERCRDEVPGPWPNPGNHMFKRVAQTVIHTYEPQGYTHFLFLEPDCLPARAGWLKELNDLYMASGKPFYGPRCYAGPDKTVPYTNGASFYPSNCQDYTERFIICSDAPFDIYASMVTLDLTAEAPDEVWKMAFRSKEYTGRFDDWSAVSNRRAEPLALSGSFTPNLLIHHGCKDGSLLALFRKGSLSEKPTTFSDHLPPASTVKDLEALNPAFAKLPKRRARRRRDAKVG